MESANETIVPRKRQKSAAPGARVPAAGYGVAVFILGLLTSSLYAFVIYPRQHTLEPCIDLNGFGRLSRNIALGEGFTLGQGPTLRRAPLFPAWAAGILKIFDNYDSDVPDEIAYRPVLAVQCLL